MSKAFTFEELSALSTKDNIHLLINGKVYAIASFMAEHPGGDEVLMGEVGRDATEAFEDVGHSDEARSMLDEYLVGTCSEAAPKGPANAKLADPAVKASSSEPSGFGYLLPLAFLAAYLGYRFYISA